MTYDFNLLETRAKELISSGRIREAMEMYYFMADGDASLDAGYLAYRLAKCSEKLGELHAAKYWYGRAVEENPGRYRKALARLQNVDLDHLLASDATTGSPQRRSA
jgi:tetratricopeptide (TPR) repeat protein